MNLKELNLSNKIVADIANKLQKTVDKILKSEVYTTSDFLSMAKWIKEYDKNAFTLIDELDCSYVVDPSKSLLGNYLLQTGQVFEIDDYILFVYI